MSLQILRNVIDHFSMMLSLFSSNISDQRKDFKLLPILFFSCYLFYPNIPHYEVLIIWCCPLPLNPSETDYLLPDGFCCFLSIFFSNREKPRKPSPKDYVRLLPYNIKFEFNLVFFHLSQWSKLILCTSLSLMH